MSRSLGNVAGTTLAVTASAIANAATRSAIEGSGFGDNLRRALPDAIGSTLGNLIGSASGGPSQVALAKAAADPVAANAPTTGDRAAEAVTMDATDRAIARAIASVAAANDPVSFGRDPQAAAAAYAAGEAKALAEYDALSRDYAGLSDTDRLNFQSRNNVLLPVRSTAVADPNYLPTDQHRDASTMAELVVWEGTIRSLETQHGGSFSNSQDLRDAFAYNRTTLAQSYGYADRQVWELTSSIIAPLAAPTAAFRMAVNGEITWGNGITVGASLLGLGALGKEVAAGARLATAGRVAETALPAVGGHIPNAGGVIRQFTQQGDQVYYRVFSGDSSVGSFLTAVPPRSSAYAREALALPPGNEATFVQEVLVAHGTPVLRSRALPQPAWGRTRGGAEQFELLQHIPTNNFGPGRPLP